MNDNPATDQNPATVPAAPAAASSQSPARSLLVLNPRSGQRRTRIVRQKVERVLAQGGPVEVFETQAAGDAFRAARALGEVDAPPTARIVVLGGDGTVNEVANGLQAGGRCDVPIGLVPFGTGNLLAKQYRIPIRRSRAAARVALNGVPQRLDLIHVSYPGDDARNPADTGLIATDRRPVMVGLAGAGFDAEVVRRFHASRKKWAPGVGWYAWVTLRVLFGWKSPVIRVVADGQELEPARWVLVCNTRTVGGPLCFAPMARPDDGVLDVVLFRKPPHSRMFSYWWWLVARQNATGHRDVQHVTVRDEVTISVASDSSGNSVPCQIDGDPVGNAPIRFRPDHRHHLRILAPA